MTLKHLRWATPKENHADKIAHGTSSRSLTDNDVREIRRLKGQVPRQELARQYGVVPQTSRISKSAGHGRGFFSFEKHLHLAAGVSRLARMLRRSQVRGDVAFIVLIIAAVDIGGVAIGILLAFVI